MVFKVYSGRVCGIYGMPIVVEVDASGGLPCLEMIGLLGNEVREAKDRVRVALHNMGVTLPPMRITVNLSPADERKAGAQFDLPIAIAILGVFGHIQTLNPDKVLVIGELALDGEIKAVHGILPIVQMAKEQGFQQVILPMDNAAEGAMVCGIDVIPFQTLAEVMAYLSLEDTQKPFMRKPYVGKKEDEIIQVPSYPDFCEVIGQESVKRAAALSAAGFHHFLMSGPPGTGKSLIAKRIPGIMPPMTYEESLEVTTIYSVSGKLNKDSPLIRNRPFYSPHHSATPIALTGGGVKVTPGLVSLAHRGILFLDELTEFEKPTLDLLRQPLEEGQITLSRSRMNVIYPASFMLVGALNPCPCGFFPDKRCKCKPSEIQRYLKKLSGPILDRIDICVETSNPENANLKPTGDEVSTDELKSRVQMARERQKARYKGTGLLFNAQLTGCNVSKYIKLGVEEEQFMNKLYQRLHLSTRAVHKVIKVARTIADYDNKDEVTKRHLAEAASYRFPDYNGMLLKEG